MARGHCYYKQYSSNLGCEIGQYCGLSFKLCSLLTKTFAFNVLPLSQVNGSYLPLHLFKGKRKNIILWLTVCCFQRKQTFKTLDGLVLEIEELDFPKILYCCSSKGKNPRFYLFSYIGLDLRRQMQQPVNHTFSHSSPSDQTMFSKYQNPLFLYSLPPQSS